MPDISPILSLPLIMPAQAQKHVTHNEALRLLDVMVQLAVLNRNLSAAPALPAVGDRHIVAAGAVGSWAGQVGKIALYTSTGWQFFAPLQGWQAHVLAEGVTVVYAGLVWAAPPVQSTAPIFGVNTTADTTNRLAVRSAATLLSHDGAGHQVKVNKAAVGDTASLLFQTGFSGRAEMGLAGSDGFAIKVSANGSTFTEALAADPATGSVSLAKPAILGGQTSDPGSPSNGMIWHNSTSGEIKVRAGGVTQVVGAGAGVADGDKGDITVSGTGTVWAIDAGVVTLAKMASVATNSLLGRATAGSGVPEALTAAQARTVLNVANGATANSADATLLARASHTGVQLSTTISDFDEAAQDAIGAMVNSSLVYTDATPSLVRAALTGDVTAPVGSNALTLSDDAVTNSKLANMAAATIKGNNSGTAGDPVDLTSAQTTAMLDNFTSALKGLVPASGGGTTTFLRADGAFATPAGGAPGGASGKVQFNNAAAFGGAANVEIEGGNLKLIQAADPAAPANGLLAYANLTAGRAVPKLRAAGNQAYELQTALHGNAVFSVTPATSTTIPLATGGVLTASVTISHQQTIASANRWQATRRTRIQTSTVAGTTSGIRTAYGQWFLGNAAGFGGFFFRAQLGMNINLAGGQKFVGLCTSTAGLTTDASALLNMIGMGYDAADLNTGNWFLIRNDGAGIATKVDLGSGAARNTNDGYDLVIYARPNTAEVFVRITNLQTGAVVLDTSYTTDIPVVNTALAFKAECRNGAVTAADNIEIAKCYIESDY